ncbi:hypothetical protein AGR4C_Cc160046 [Agrobacterium tumefaciens str. Kerr 14]|uniref:Uncharacterized protein n=1 Tax=Agrobacterium tumefaciens str. Kerr 14 TaxID=1183424 RepID=A0A1S7P462_AGRTU|nr:hypothetical protein AGR4C_Cc160046 [Agrobacterium tumefaciens str. Kerr 14]
MLIYSLLISVGRLLWRVWATLFCAFEACSTLIPVPVTGIQPMRVGAAEGLLSAQGLGLAGSL